MKPSSDLEKLCQSLDKYGGEWLDEPLANIDAEQQ